MYNYKQQNNQLNNKNKLKYLKIYEQQLFAIEYFLNKNSITKKTIKIYIKTTLNNMFVTYTFNNKIYTKSIASLGFKGKAKQTRYAFKTFSEFLIKNLLEISNNNILILDLYLNPLNKKLKSFFTLFKINNIKINKIYDITPIPYNGCRKRKISIKKKKKSIIKFLSY